MPVPTARKTMGYRRRYFQIFGNSSSRIRGSRWVTKCWSFGGDAAEARFLPLTMTQFPKYLVRLWLVLPRLLCILATIAFTGYPNPNFMTGGATDRDYTAGYDIAIDRERRGLPPPPEQQSSTWNS